MKKPRKSEVVEVRFRLKTDALNCEIVREAKHAAGIMRNWLNAEIVRKPTVEMVGKR